MPSICGTDARAWQHMCFMDYVNTHRRNSHIFVVASSAFASTKKNIHALQYPKNGAGFNRNNADPGLVVITRK